jgi:hypothetical protein
MKRQPATPKEAYDKERQRSKEREAFYTEERAGRARGGKSVVGIRRHEEVLWCVWVKIKVMVMG